MTLKEKILSGMKEAMKKGEKKRKSTLRMLLSEIQYAQTASNQTTELDERALMAVVARYRKKLEKSLENYPEGEQKTNILEEISIVADYLPKEASKEEVEVLVESLLKDQEEKHFGKLMKAALSKLGASANAKVVGEIIKKKLG